MKQLEEKLEDKSTWSDKTTSYLEEKQKWDVEKAEFETIMGLLNTHIREAKYSATDHEEELMKTVKLQGIYQNVIKAFLKDTEKLYEEILENTDKKRKPPLCERISGFICLKWKRNEKKMKFLLKEKCRATNEAEELESKVKRARHILNIFGAIMEDQQKELDIIYERMKTLDERLPEKSPLCARLAALLCGTQTERGDNILHRHKCQNRHIAETLERKMKDIEKLHYIYEILTEKIEDKIVRLRNKVKIIDDRLLSLNNHPLVAQKLQKIMDLELGMTNNSTEHNMVMSLQKDLQREREKLISANKKVSDLEHELDCKKTQIVVERREASQEMLVLLAKVSEAQEYKKEFDSIITKLEEDLKTERAQLTAVNKKVQECYLKETELREKLEKVFKKEDLQAHVQEGQTSIKKLQRTQSLLSSKEAEVQQVKDINLKLERRNNQLEQENVKLITELNKVKTRQDATEESSQHLAHECECLQEKIRNLQSEQADSPANGNQKQNLQTKSATVVTDNLGMLELLKRCFSAQLPKHEDDATIDGLEKENKDLNDVSLCPREKRQTKTARHGKKHVKKLQQQVSTTTANSDMVSHLLQQLNVHLTDRVGECEKTKEELISLQQANQKLTEELYCIFMECNRLNQKYNEDQMKCETMLCQAEHKFNKETARLSSTIQTLKKEVKRLTLLLTEEKERFLEYRMKLGTQGTDEERKKET
ncbi:unnamed protein product [Tetraodon nigroviridis]|uniref:(spotted green pufferfish) hypothetical protein n=1 Tax=Tetraodon nigroviridis TaxID=99883 RepID=Q4S648_TETNG|nr:unnamed protein product [Tetraodon nigroviridis]